MSELYGNRWELIKSLDEGGQAHVFLVKDAKNQGDRMFVLKRLKNLNRLDRFKKEIEIVRHLQDDHVVKIFDFKAEGEKPYFVTSYYEGGNLKDARNRWKENPLIALGLFKTICETINNLHRMEPPIIHRDLKPENIFLRSKDKLDPVIGDFGVCYFENGQRITLIEEAVGPRLFMAPELEDGREDKVTPKADVYSLGKLLYWMLRDDGQLFSREKHRLREWDLRKAKDLPSGGYDWENIYFEHVSRILDQMITTAPDERASLNQILPQLSRAIRLIEREFTPITQDAAMPCEFCGQGEYVLTEKGTHVEDFGFRAIGSPNWRILVCNICGHVQLFRVEKAAHKDWWGEK